MSDSCSSSFNLSSCMYSSEASTSSVEFCGAVQNTEENLLDDVQNTLTSMAVNGARGALPQRNPPDYNEAVYQNMPYPLTNQVSYQPSCAHLNNNYRPQLTNGCGKRKRIRTAFTTYQLNDLEQHYQKNRYLERNIRLILSRKLNVSERVIKIWFQNRRMKEKKDRAECQLVEECTSTSQPSCSTNGNFVMPMQASDIIPQAVHHHIQIHAGHAEDGHVGPVINIMPMMDPQSSYVMPATSSDAQPVKYERFPNDVPPLLSNHVISPVFEDFGQYCDMQSDYYSV